MARITLYNILISCFVALGSGSYGYGFAVFPTSTGQPGFYSYFNLDPESSYTANILGAINALFNLGLALGALAQGWLADKVGRKKAFMVAAVCTLIGAALVTGSVAIGMLITVRLLHGFGLGMLVGLVPLYLTETAPARSRGLLLCINTSCISIGYFVCAWISVGTYYSVNETLRWRMPLALACVGPLAMIIGLPFIPESPRYLALAGRNDEAWEVVHTLHRDPTDFEDEAARAEFTQIIRQTDYDKELGYGYMKMFTRPSWRRRSLLAMFLMFAVQSTGVLGITNFLILIFQNLGMEHSMPLVLYGVYASAGVVWVTIGMLICDRIGRRKLLLTGFIGQGLTLLVEALLQWKYLDTHNQPGLSACVAFLFVYMLFFNMCTDGPSWAWMAEVFPTTARSRGIGLGLFSYFVGTITYTTPGALAFRNIKYNLFYLYFGLCMISAVVIYFYIPETRHVPVEELGALFGDAVVVHLTPDGHGILEEKGPVAEIVEDVALERKPSAL
ncbi:probable metabolite transport protein CsbC [Aspergillus lentulus]|uniref:Probable metabolite transport protein CsbC n=1 Tax=Aspergillus lentulus TaxID=293939 RepID=A0ABQ1B1Y9_ASPLE|nr:probable metabolite transport protein CsbC [Aspergillus lentulus]GFF92249.1 probable metabolite transport protein CsbC [Aspergillus lentulus]GFG17177.1 probable metabolite transport protein CsbC [Aspergillus lentulus]